MASATITSPRGASRPMVLPGHGPLRYANAEDLPSYPSSGLKAGDAAASAAATLGWANIPTSPRSAVAGPGSPREQQYGTSMSQDAILAAGWSQRNQKPTLPASSPPSHWVSTAANLAFKGTNTPPPAPAPSGLLRQNSMHAAKGAMAGARPRSRSSPQTEAERNQEQSAGAAALSAATLAHRPTVRGNTSSATEAGAVPYTTMDRQMFTANPPVKPETDEQNRAYVLHASALAMARKMYDQQQKMIENSTLAHARSSSFPGGGDTASLASSRNGEQQPPLIYNSLQEAAYRLAQERLNKLQEEHDKQRGMQEYYGAGAPQRTKFGTIKGKLTRRRSSSDGDLLLEDKRRSEQIRKQMSLLNNKLTEVDEDKRARDREALLAAAHRNVRAQLQQMDEKVQSDTGRVAQPAMDDWGRKALVAAQARVIAGNHDTVGKVDIGGGKFIDRAEVDKIAAEKVQPLLDEINKRAEKEVERLEAERLDEERRKEKAERDRAREKEIQDIHKKLKEQQKDDERARKGELKHEEKIRKEEAKALKAEHKQAAKEEKEKGKEVVPLTTTSKTETNDLSQPPGSHPKRSSTVGRVRALSINFTKRPKHKTQDTADKPPSPDDNATSPTHKVRAWLLSRFPRPRAKSASTTATDDHDSSESRKGFIGGAALARLHDANYSNASIDNPDKGKGKGKEPEELTPAANSSMREVAIAGRTTTFGPKGDEPGESSAAAAATGTVPPSTPPHDTQQPRRPTSQTSISQASLPVSDAQDKDRRSVSSLSSSPDIVAGGGGRPESLSSTTSEDDDDDKFVEARSERETVPAGGGGSTVPVSVTTPTVTLTPTTPRRRAGVGVGVGGGLATGRASPFRESRFSEILE